MVGLPTGTRFNMSEDDREIIDKITERAMALEDKYADGVRLGKRENRQMMWVMDLLQVNDHNPLRFKDLAEADDGNFAHDIFGIRRHLNRSSGKLEDCFRPRFSVRKEET